MREITINEVVQKIKNNLCNGGGVIMSIEGSFGNVIIPYSDNPNVTEDEEKLSVHDDNDNIININKSSIRNSIVSEVQVNDEEIRLDLGDIKFSFLLYNF